MTSWFEKIVNSITVSREEKKSLVQEGTWVNCPKCSQIFHHTSIAEQQFVCSSCGNHMQITSRSRLENFFDKNSEIITLGENLRSQDALKFKDLKKYTARLETAEKSTGLSEALLAQVGNLLGRKVVACVFNFSFMGGSMGSVVGDRFILAAKYALEHNLPFICFCASGGARMQESVFSLMQMMRTSHIIGKLKDARIPYISVLTHPTYGGVSASLAMLGDIHIAEPGAEIGFAGPRVIEQTVREKLPEGFQTSEFLLKNGFVDMIVERKNLPSSIHRILSILLPIPSLVTIAHE